MRRWSLVLFILLMVPAARALEGPAPVHGDYPMKVGRVTHPAQTAGPQDAVIGYDSGPVYFFPEATEIGTLWGVRFSPAQACTLMNVQVYAFQGGGQVQFRFVRDDNGEPGADFAAPQVHTLIGDLSLETVTLSPVVAGDSDFYVIMEIISGPPPYPVTDADGGSGRSWFQFPGQPWEHVVDFDITMRAGVRYYGEDAAGPEIVHIPVSRGFSESYSTPIRCGLNDLSGIGSAWTLYRTAGAANFDSATMVWITGNEWVAELPPFPAGTEIEYFIRAYDDSPSGNLSTLPESAPALVNRFVMHPGREIKYDDGYPEIFFYLDTAWNQNTFAVRMSPQTYPVRVNLLRAYVTDTAAFDFEVHAAQGDSLAGLLAGPFEARAQSPFTWADFEIPDAQQPTIYSGEFFVLFKWKSTSPTLPAVGADSVGGGTGRSYSYDGVFGWFKFDTFEWLIRSAVASATAVVELGDGTRPRSFDLSQNYPNPFNPQTNIDFALTRPADVKLTVYNLIGQRVATLVDEHLPAGTYRVDFDATDRADRPLPSGLYFYRLEAGAETQTRKMLLLR